METEGVGARIAWKLKSVQALLELKELLGEDKVERLGYDLGRAQIEFLNSSYGAAKDTGLLEVNSVASRGLLGFTASEAAVSLNIPNPALLFLQNSDQRGVYRVDLRAVLIRLADVLEYDGDSICITADGGVRGILVDRNVTAIGTQYLIEAWAR
jgi:hypothetical protein